MVEQADYVRPLTAPDLMEALAQAQWPSASAAAVQNWVVSWEWQPDVAAYWTPLVDVYLRGAMGSVMIEAKAPGRIRDIPREAFLAGQALPLQRLLEEYSATRLAPVEQTDQQQPRFSVDPDRIDELIDWAVSRDWEADEGERARHEAWRD